MIEHMTLWPSGLRRCVKAAVFLAWVRIPPESILYFYWFSTLKVFVYNRVKPIHFLDLNFSLHRVHQQVLAKNTLGREVLSSQLTTKPTTNPTGQDVSFL